MNVEARARWVLETLGAPGAEVELRPEAWEQVERGERPQGDEIAEAFFHLARVEERDGPRDQHGRFPVAASCLDPLDPPLERLRARLGAEPPRWGGATFAVALTHDVDTPWRWTAIGVRGAAARLKSHALAGRGRAALREARALSSVPVHRLRRTDPNWSFERVISIERERDAGSTFFVMAGHRHAADGASPETYDRLRPRLVETLRSGGAEIGLHGSYTAAQDAERLREEKEALEELAGPVEGQRYHYLRVDPHANLEPLDQLGFAYDSSLGFAGAVGFRWGSSPVPPLGLRAGTSARPGRDSSRSDGRDVRGALPQPVRSGGGAASDAAARGRSPARRWLPILWHTDRFDPASSQRWDRLYERVIDAVHELGGVCMSAGALAKEAAASLP